METVLLSFFVTAYGVLASLIALRYRIIFDNRIPWDAYFSFDNRAIVLTGGGFERHPLSNYFFDALRHMALWISKDKYDATFRLILAWFSVIAISFTMLQIFKYLKNIIGLPNKISVFIVIFFSMFSTNILLSFTPETYTYTLFFLCIYNNYCAKKIKNNEKISALALILGSITIGGMTITNIVKVYIPVLFERHLLSSYKKMVNAVIRSLIAVSVFLLLFLNRINFDYQRIFSTATQQYEKFSKPKITPLWDMILSWFFGGNLLFSNFEIRDYHSRTGFEFKAVFMDVYSSWVPYFFVIILLLLMIWSYAKNFKNSLVQILIFSFAVDIIIHCVLKFGLHTSYIYGGHFVFVYPLLLGWLFYSYKKSVFFTTALFSTLILLILYLGFNNFLRMEEFFIFLERHYQ